MSVAREGYFQYLLDNNLLAPDFVEPTRTPNAKTRRLPVYIIRWARESPKYHHRAPSRVPILLFGKCRPPPQLKDLNRALKKPLTPVITTRCSGAGDRESQSAQ